MTAPGQGAVRAGSPVAALSDYPAAAGQSSGLLVRMRRGVPAGARVSADPWDVARAFPARWRRFLADHYRNDTQAAAAFGVTERTVRKWREGVGGCNGDKVAIAVARHPETAPVYLFAQEHE